jgi:hypothetical protein
MVHTCTQQRLTDTPGQGGSPMETKKILVPYNFTGNDERAIDFVVNTFGRAPDVEITLFHTYVPVPDIDISDKTVMARLSGNLTYLRQKIKDLETAIAGAAKRLVDAGFAEEKVTYIFKPQQRETSQEIIDHAVNGDYSTIVLNHNPSKIRKFFSASISKKVTKALSYKKVYIVG